MTEKNPETKSYRERTLHLFQVCQELAEDISLDSLPEKIIKAACAEVNAEYGFLYLLDDKGKLRRFATQGFSSADAERLCAALQNSSPANKPLGLSSVFGSVFPDINWSLSFPLVWDSTGVGSVLLANNKNSPTFSGDDQKIAEALARFACVALKNASSYKDLVIRDRTLLRRNENLALLDRLAATLATSTEISQILENGLMQLMDHLRLDTGEIYLRQEESRNINLVVHRGASGDRLWNRSQFVVGKGIVGEVVKSNTPSLIVLGKDEAADLNPRVSDSGIQQVLVVPMAGRRGVIGALCAATDQPQPLDELEVQFLQAIGSWMATAIENVNLNIHGQRTAILEERDRIGMDLHDGIIQSIYAVGLTLEHANLLLSEDPEQAGKRIGQSITDLNSVIRDIRAYILDLRPRQLFNEDLMTGIGRLVAEFKANTMVDVNLQGPAEDISGLPNNQAVALFHICQEALANIAKHAHARHVDVILWTTNERLLLEIRDDGVGFNPEKTKVTIGHGLSNMETRIVNADGEVDISSEPGKGTTILTWIPLHSDDGMVDDYYE